MTELPKRLEGRATSPFPPRWLNAAFPDCWAKLPGGSARNTIISHAEARTKMGFLSRDASSLSPSVQNINRPLLLFLAIGRTLGHFSANDFRNSGP